MTARRLAVAVAAGILMPGAALAAGPAIAAAHPGPAAAKGGIAVVGWGVNADGQLGNNTTTNSSKPVFAELLASIRYTTVRTGQSSLALTSSGRVWGWGDNTFGQLGDGTTTDRLLPVAVAGLTGVTDISTGMTDSCAITGGAALCWGMKAGTGRTQVLAPTPVRTPVF